MNETSPSVTTPRTLSDRINWATTGSVLPLALGIGYLVSYLRAYAYLHHFGLPASLISISTTEVIAAAVVVLAYTVATSLVLSAGIFWAARKPSSVRIGCVVLLLFGTVTTPYIWAFRIRGPLVLAFLVASAGVTVGPGLLRRVRRLPAPAADQGQPTVAEAMNTHLGLLGMAGLAMIYGAVSFYGMGMSEARYKTVFPVNRASDEVLVATYGDRGVLVPLGDRPRELTAGFRVVSLTQPPSLEFVRERIGPLNVRPVLNPWPHAE